MADSSPSPSQSAKDKAWISTSAPPVHPASAPAAAAFAEVSSRAFPSLLTILQNPNTVNPRQNSFPLAGRLKRLFMSPLQQLLVLAAISYFLGSIPFGLIVGLWRGID